MYDITIVGAGPAGATLARLIGKKYKVLLLDKRQLIDNNDKIFSSRKCCGGLLAPDAQKMLARFGLGIPKNILVGPQLFVVKTIDIQNSIEKYYQRHYINTDREKFDCWLASLIPSEVDMRCRCLFKNFKRNEDSLEIKYIVNDKEYTDKTKVLIGADGAFSSIRRQGFKNNIFPKLYISIQEWLECDNIVPYYLAIFDKDITDFYSWIIPKENFLILGSALSPKDKSYDKFELLKRKISRYGVQLGKSIRKNGAYLYRTKSNNQICIGKNNIALIGEAAGWISPSSAEGLSYSFRSALALAKSLENGIHGFADRYSNNTRTLQRNIFLKNLKCPFMYNQLVRKCVMQSGIMSMDVYD